MAAQRTTAQPEMFLMPDDQLVFDCTNGHLLEIRRNNSKMCDIPEKFNAFKTGDGKHLDWRSAQDRARLVAQLDGRDTSFYKDDSRYVGDIVHNKTIFKVI